MLTLFFSATMIEIYKNQTSFPSSTHYNCPDYKQVLFDRKLFDRSFANCTHSQRRISFMV